MSAVDISFRAMASDDLEEAIVDIKRLLIGHRMTRDHLATLRMTAEEEASRLVLKIKQIATRSQQLSDGLNGYPRIGPMAGRKKRGYNRQFFASKRSVPSLEYYAHCIEECVMYKELHLIQECTTCKYKFLNAVSLARHMTTFHRGQKLTRSWMSRSVTNQNSMNRSYNYKVRCLGCREEFPAHRRGTRILPRMDFFIHCVEECEKYQQLGLIKECLKCQCKFLTNHAFAVHKCISNE